MKDILTIAFFSLCFICLAQSQGKEPTQEKFSLNVGVQYYVGRIDYFNFLSSIIYIDHHGILYNIGGEYKMNKRLSINLDVGLFGKENLNNGNSNNWTNIILDPFRFHFKQVFRGIYIGPRLMYSNVSSGPESFSALIPGLVLGFNYGPKDSPLNVGLNISTARSLTNNIPYASSANVSLGYKF